jgi:hypothetical protein
MKALLEEKVSSQLESKCAELKMKQDLAGLGVEVAELRRTQSQLSVLLREARAEVAEVAVPPPEHRAPRARSLD